MFVTVTTGNHSGAVIALRPDQEDNAIAKPTQTSQPLFAVLIAFIFHRDHRGIEYAIDLSQVNAVRLEVLLALALIPDDHVFIVVTKNSHCPVILAPQWSSPTIHRARAKSRSGPVTLDVDCEKGERCNVTALSRRRVGTSSLPFFSASIRATVQSCFSGNSRRRSGRHKHKPRARASRPFPPRDMAVGQTTWCPGAD